MKLFLVPHGMSLDNAMDQPELFLQCVVVTNSIKRKKIKRAEVRWAFFRILICNTQKITLLSESDSESVSERMGELYTRVSRKSNQFHNKKK